MARVEGKVNFQLSVTPEEKAMIKADAKALNMPVARYVVMVCKLVNDSCKEAAAEEMTNRMVKAVMRGAGEALREGTKS